MQYPHAQKASATSLSNCGHLTPMFENGVAVHSETLATIRARIQINERTKPACLLPEEWAESIKVSDNDVQEFTQLVQINKHSEEE